MSKTYYRPLISPCARAPRQGGFQLAGGWCWFHEIEVLSRTAPPKIIPAHQAPPALLERLTKPRPTFAGLSLASPRVMGIVNVTPDSFSDGGDNLEVENALSTARLMEKDGADFIDIGAESTRPNADFVPAKDEIARLLPILLALKKENIKPPVSVDTRKAEVAQKALSAGAEIINDVSALTFDDKMAQIAAEKGAPVCLMHTQGTPKTMQNQPHYDDVLLSIYDYLETRIDAAHANGIKRDKIIIDPGIGFGKTLAHNCALLKGIALFHALGTPILLGTSRKRFIDLISPEPIPKKRLGGSLASALYALSQGVQITRVHDVFETTQAFKIWQAINHATPNSHQEERKARA